VADACLAESTARGREHSRAELAASVRQDARFALRALRRTPLATAAALLTLALGVGATTAIFSVVYGVLVRPLPYRDADRLVHLWEAPDAARTQRIPVSVPTFRDWAARTRSFSHAVAYATNLFTLTGEGTPEQVRALMAWGDLGPMLGVRPLLGR